MLRFLGLALLAAAIMCPMHMSLAEDTSTDGKSMTLPFQADVTKIMDIIIHSLYSNKEIFLRELISNASDALDKIRFFLLTEPEKYGSATDAELKIRVVPNKESNTLTVEDTGIGMTKEQLISELGTVARSGTTSFIEAFEQNADVSLIGQFGVGFYSVYLVADTVTVTSKHPDSDKTYRWESSADQTYTVSEVEDAEFLQRGTQVTLHLKEEAAEFLEVSKLKEVIKRHSQFINYPIYLEVEREVQVTVTEEEDEDEEQEGEEAKDEDDEAVVEDEDEEQDEDEDKDEEKKTRTEKRKEDELINESKPLWMRPPGEIEEKEYHDFFKVLTKGHEDPAAYSHFNAEGEVEFRSILYAPKSAPFDAYQDYNKQKGTISLYVRRVLITDEFEDLLPNYLGFVRGVVDSDSLPLNVNREMLQQSKVLKVIGKKLVRKAIAMLQTLANKHKSEESTEDEEEKSQEEEQEKEEEPAEDNEDYLSFFKQFGKFIKLGVAEDRSNQARLAKLLRFPTTHRPDGVTGLEAYVERMKDDQKAIYYIAGDSVDALQKHPTIEKLTKRGYEVFLLTDPLDEHCLQSLGEFQSHKISDTSRATLKLDETEEEKKRLKKIEEMYKPVVSWYKDVLANEVEKVVISKRLETSPCAVVAGDYGWTANMERIMTSQVFTNTDNMGYMKARKTLELNPAHPVIKRLLVTAEETAKKESGDEEGDGQADESADFKAAKDSAILLYQTCLLQSGFSLPATSATEFSARLERLIRSGLQVSPEEEVEEVEVELSESESEKPEDVADDGKDDLEEEDDLGVDHEEKVDSAAEDAQEKNHDEL